MQDTTGLAIRAASLDGSTCKVLSGEEATRLHSSKSGLVWIDIVVHDLDQGRRLLEDDLGFHSLAVEDALSPNERPTLQEFDGYLFFVVPSLNKSHTIHESVEVAFFVSEHSMVTVTTKHCDVVTDWFTRWCSNPKPLDGSVAMLLHSVVDGIVDEYFPFLDELEDSLDQLADDIFSGDTSKVKEILVLKRKLLETRRQMSPVREIMNGLLRRDISLIPERTKPYFQDVLDHVIRIAELVDMNRDTLASLLDVHLSQVSNNLNLVVKQMTVVATVLMIMTLVAGVYGMNFQYMPELHWRYGYAYAWGLMIGLAVLTVWIFKKIRWI